MSPDQWQENIIAIKSKYAYTPPLKNVQHGTTVTVTVEPEPRARRKLVKSKKTRD